MQKGLKALTECELRHSAQSHAGQEDEVQDFLEKISHLVKTVQEYSDKIDKMEDDGVFD